MATMPASSVERPAPAPVVVALPRRTDAVGNTLRQVFRSTQGLPDQWRSALRRLDALD